MPDMNDELAWCRQRLAAAKSDLRSVFDGARYEMNGRDFTANIRQRALSDIDGLEKLISALQRSRVT